MSKENDEDVVDIELNKAIADSISSLNYQHDENEKSDNKGSHRDDIDLENAIGDVFDQFDFGDTTGKQEKETLESNHGQNKNVEHLELNEAIGNTLGSMNVNKQTNKQSQNATHTDAEIQTHIDGVKESNNQGDDELQTAIGNAIDSLDGKLPERSLLRQSDENPKEIQEVEEDLHPHEIRSDAAKEANDRSPIEDDALEKAIRDALGSGQAQEQDHMENFKDDTTTSSGQTAPSTDLDKHKEVEETPEKIEEAIDNALNSLHYTNQQYEEIHSNSRPEHDKQNEKNDDDLSKAIASAFSDIAGNTNDQDSTENNDRGENEDLDLSEAIGNAFKNISELAGTDYESKLKADKKLKDLNYEIEKSGKKQPTKSDVDKSLKELTSNKADYKRSSRDEDLNEVISASLKQLLGDHNSEKKGKDTLITENTQTNPLSSNGTDKHDNIDSFMENIISEAFRNVSEQGRITHDLTSSTKANELEKQPETGLDLSNLVQTMVNQMSHAEENTKTHLENMPISEDILQELALEITNQVQDQIDDESQRKAKSITDMPQIDENVLAHFQNEAYKDDKYNENDKLDTGKALADDGTLQAALATAVRNAIENNATTLNDASRRLSFSQGTKQDNEHDDLEQLQMNDILQNAFNMAMENPHDLLSNLEMEDEKDEHHQDKSNLHFTSAKSQNNQVASALARLPHPLPASTTTFLESLNRSNDIDLSDSSTHRKKKSQNQLANNAAASEPIASHTDRISAVAKNIMNNIAKKSLSLNKRDDSKKNTLSIAETLALHRSSMASGPKRDYTSLEPLGGALSNEYGSRSGSSPINSQVSNVLSSLSSRINSSASSSGADNNLLQVIRQMTSALTSKPSISSSSYLHTSATSVSDIVNSYKDKRDEYAIISPLVLAKKFLEEKQMAPNSGKAISLLDNVLELFNFNQSSESNIDPSMRNTPFVGSQFNLENVKPEFISSISSSVTSAISSFGSKSKRGSFFGEKLKTDSPEYKERIRLENRERKKRWREENAERNKDNDLRSRVLKRATLMFGEKDTSEKKSWVDEEFNKRREKRIAKQKKDDFERQNKGFDEDNLDRKSFNNREPNALVHDPNLIKPITDVFNIVSNSAQNEDPDAALAATSAATATAAAIYASTNNTTNFKMVESAVSKILLSLMENSQSTSQEERFAGLSKGVTSSFKIEASPLETSLVNKQALPSKLPDSELTSLVKTTSVSTSGILNRLSASIKGLTPSTLSALSNTGNVSNSLLQLQGLTLNNNTDSSTQKRKSIEPLPHEVKRSRPPSPLSESKSSVNNAAITGNENLESGRNTDSASSISTHSYNGSNALKIPHYKKPDISSVSSANPNIDESNIDPAIKKEYPTLLLTSTSPFISNKANYLSMGGSLSNPSVLLTSSNLKKPGSFQRPSYSKPEKNKSDKVFGGTMYSKLRET